MKYVNIMDAKEQFADLVTQLDTYQQDKIVLTYDEKPVVEMIRAPKKIRGKRIFGIGKNELKLPPDFDEVFDSLDAEIGKMFFKEAVQ